MAAAGHRSQPNRDRRTERAAAQAAAEQNCTETIGRALALLRDPDCFARESIDRSASLDSYVQEIGQTERDGKKAKYVRRS